MPRLWKRAKIGVERMSGRGAERSVPDLERAEGWACRRRWVRRVHLLGGREARIWLCSEGVRNEGR